MAATYSPAERLAIVTAACELIGQGEIVLDACKAQGITRISLWRWCKDDTTLGQIYASARDLSAGALDDEALRVARATTPERCQADRLLVDTLKWAAAKRRPREYSEKHQVDVMGGEDNTLRIVVERMGAEERETRIGEIMTTLEQRAAKQLNSGEGTP